LLITKYLRRVVAAAAAGSLAGLAIAVPGAATAAAGPRAMAAGPVRMVAGPQGLSGLRAVPVRTSSTGVTYFELYSALWVSVAGGKSAVYFCLDADDSHPIGDGTKVQAWQCKGTKNQLWTAVPVSDTTPPPHVSSGAFEFVNADGGYCLDAETAPTPIGNGTKVQLWKCNGRPQQAWFGSGYFNGGETNYVNGRTDPANGSPLCLDVAAPSDGVQAKVQDCKYQDLTQLWDGEPPVSP
jgi:hypothetical protein